MAPIMSLFMLPLRDYSIFAICRQRLPLQAAGVPTKYKVFDGCYHAFDVAGNKYTPAKEAKLLLMENFRYAVEHYFAPQSEMMNIERSKIIGC